MQTETRIQVADIPEEGLFLNFAELSHLIPEVDEYVQIGNTSGRLEIQKSGNDIEIRGWVKSTVNLVCDRCLKTFPKEIETSFFYLLQPRDTFGADLEPDHQLSTDEIDVYWYEDGEIRGEELFREQILLQLPMRVLCSEECKGLCPGCGEDLNESECKCAKENVDSPFAVLAQLKSSR
ncbi:MAG: DUF177 domain-containing protein [Thermodesulfobacteria bacterium]|nr:DUF177 domain-containing protein [Thermodesulfobacteriota bacterium]